MCHLPKTEFQISPNNHYYIPQIDMAKWADLPSDLLSHIIRRLPFFDDIAIFGAVCKSWQLAIALADKPSSPPKFPWLMLAEEKEERDESNKEEEIQTRSFYNLLDTRIYKFKLPEASSRKCLGASFGWLLTIGTDLQINLLHPLSKCQISLPPQPTFSDQYSYYLEPEVLRHIFIRKAVLSTTPWKSSADDNDPDFVIMTICGEVSILAFARPGDKAWINVETPSRAYDDIVYYKGKFYAVDCHGVVFICDIDDDQNPRARAIAPAPEGTMDIIKKYLVESSGDLLLVSRIRGGRFYCLDYVEDDSEEDASGGEEDSEEHDSEVEDFEEDSEEEIGIDNDNHYVTIGFTVLRLEQCNQGGSRYYNLVKVESLGDRALFLGDSSSFSFSTSNFNGCKANCIYFTDDNLEVYPQGGGGYDMGVFNMEDGTIKPHYTGQSLSDYSTPIWYT